MFPYPQFRKSVLGGKTPTLSVGICSVIRPGKAEGKVPPPSGPHSEVGRDLPNLEVLHSSSSLERAAWVQGLPEFWELTRVVWAPVLC